MVLVMEGGSSSPQVGDDSHGPAEKTAHVSHALQAWSQAGEPVPWALAAYQISEASLTGVCSMISGATNSGQPNWLYCGSVGQTRWAKPKSQILMSSRAGCTMRMLGGCQAELGCTSGQEGPMGLGQGDTD